MALNCFAETSKPASGIIAWNEYEIESKKTIAYERTRGLSYLISGSLALLGGLVGAEISSDPLEKGTYVLFQSIGIASIGYGFYLRNIGDNERVIYHSLKNNKLLTDQQRTVFLENYLREKKEKEKEERFVKAITHGMIAVLNFYNASQQKQDSTKNALMFIGTANTLAFLSYTF